MLLKIARRRAKKSRLLQADMLTMDLATQFDVVACLFSSIGYVHGTNDLREVIRNFASHLKPRGVLLISPWVNPKDFKVGRPHLQTYDSPDIKIARAVVSQMKNKDSNISVINFNWMIAEKGKEVQHIDGDVHELAMHSHEDLIDAMKAADIKGKFRQKNQPGGGMYVGLKV